jgi:C4-dicarboxylate transporter, DctM subunit
METIIGVVIMVVALIIGVPIPFSFGISIIFLTFSLGFQPDALLPSGYSKLGSVVLLAIPLFILAGGIMEKGKIGSAITGLVNLFIGRIKGSLAYVTVISSALFGSISGSATATLACIGSVMAPELKRSKYPIGIYASIIANSSPLGLLIPPSAAQILYAWAGNQSVLACFLSTVIPGIILTFFLCVVSFFLLRNKDIIQSPKQTARDWSKDVTVQTKKSIPALLMPVIILGGIYGGIMTPTESAAVAVLYAIPVGMFIYKGLDMKSLQSAFLETGTTTGVVMVMFFMVMIFSKILILQNVPSIIINFFTAISSNKILILLMINVFMIIIGMLMDDVSGILLCTPLLLPIVMKLGVHPVHFAAILGVNLGMGNITPPTAPLLYFGARVCNANVSEMLKPTLWLILFAWFPTLLITTYVPEVALYLPRLILGGKF